jgi:hypothetical protein
VKHLANIRQDIPQKPGLIFNGLHGVISLKIGLLITTAVRTSNPKYLVKLPAR